MPRNSSSLTTDLDSSTAHARARTLSPWEKRRAVRTAAHHATNAPDLAHLLAMLGLAAADGKATA